MSDTLDLAVASKSTYNETLTSDEISERLDEVAKLVDRTKTLYEQYFMGIQKMAPMQLHRDIERKVREITQLNIRNTGLRFRFATITQKFGSYNSYWRRIMRQIEQGKYVRDVARVSRKAARTGKDVPDEILASMPKRMREKVLRDRELLAKRHATSGNAGNTEAAGDTSDDSSDEIAQIHSPPPPRQAPNTAHQIDDTLLGDFDLDDMFSSITDEAVNAVDKIERRSAAASAETVATTPPRPARAPAPAPASAPARRAPPPVPARAAPPPVPARAAPPAVPARAAPPAGPRQSRPRPAEAPVSLPPGMNEKQTKDLYDRYVQARKLVGESTDNVSYQRLVRTLNKQAPRIMQQHNAKGVDFNVVIKGDKVILKAKPKK